MFYFCCKTTKHKAGEWKEPEMTRCENETSGENGAHTERATPEGHVKATTHTQLVVSAACYLPLVTHTCDVGCGYFKTTILGGCLAPFSQQGHQTK